jgi:hypothetical protein
MAPIERITLFNIPDEAARDRVLEQYKILAKTAVKVPYLFNLTQPNLIQRALLTQRTARTENHTFSPQQQARLSLTHATRDSISP